MESNTPEAIITPLPKPSDREIMKSRKLDDVCYDIRGPVLKEAHRLEEEGHTIIKLNIGNPAPFGFEAPEEILVDVIHNLPDSQGYCDFKGLYSARKAIMQYCQQSNMSGVEIDDILPHDWASLAYWMRAGDDAPARCYAPTPGGVRRLEPSECPT